MRPRPVASSDPVISRLTEEQLDAFLRVMVRLAQSYARRLAEAADQEAAS